METVKAASLILDFAVYPRNQIDDTHVLDLARAVEAGIELPPVIADKKSKRVVDGFHRVRRALRDGPDAEIAVEWRRYKNEADLFLDAVRLNAGHGRRFSHFDQAHCLVIADRMQIDSEYLASALSLTVDRLSHLRMTKTAIGPMQVAIPIKQTLGHLAGQPLTSAQVEGNQRATGAPQMLYVNQLINVIESGTLNIGNERLMERLQHLARLLDSIVAAAV